MLLLQVFKVQRILRMLIRRLVGKKPPHWFKDLSAAFKPQMSRMDLTEVLATYNMLNYESTPKLKAKTLRYHVRTQETQWSSFFTRYRQDEIAVARYGPSYVERQRKLSATLLYKEILSMHSSFVALVIAALCEEDRTRLERLDERVRLHTTG